MSDSASLAEEAKGPTLNELFDRDPRTLTDDEIRSITKALRDARARFLPAEAKARASGKAPKVALKDVDITVDI